MKQNYFSHELLYNEDFLQMLHLALVLSITKFCGWFFLFFFSIFLFFWSRIEAAKRLRIDLDLLQ